MGSVTPGEHWGEAARTRGRRVNKGTLVGMRLRCLIVDGESVTRSLLWSVVRNTRHLDLRHMTSYTEAMSALKSQFPHLLLLRCCDEIIGGERVLKMLQRTKMSVATVALLDSPNPEQIKTLVGTYDVLDVLMDNAEVDRIQKALREVTDAVAKESDQRSYYRGFFGFVGSIPSFRERKVLASAGIGFIQNRSLRLAIEYWRKNPSSQMVALCLNAHETFTSRPDDFCEAWADSVKRGRISTSYPGRSACSRPNIIISSIGRLRFGRD